MGDLGDRGGPRPVETSSESVDSVEDLDRQIAEGIAAEERAELVDGETAMAEILAELRSRSRRA